MPDTIKTNPIKQEVKLLPKPADPSKDTKEKEIKKKILSEAEVWLTKKQKRLQLSEIGLTLDSYDDIFSDFDPRHYSERSLSDDFLAEMKRATREKTSGVIELKLLIPQKIRKVTDEEIIKKRLRNHFRRHHDMLRKEVNKVKKIGELMVVGGFFLGILAALVLDSIILDSIDNSYFFTNILYWLWMVMPKVILVLVEPASWFLIWEGANQLMSGWEAIKPDLKFYEKMTKCEIIFEEY